VVHRSRTICTGGPG